MKPFSRKPTLLFQFTMSYLLILLIPIVMGTLHFTNVLQLATDQTVYANTLILKNSMERVEGSLRSLSSYSAMLNRLKALDGVVSASDRDRIDLLQLQQAAELFPKFKDDSNYVDKHFLYSSRNGIILGPSQAFLNVEMYYGSYFDFGDMPFDDWRSRILFDTDRPTGVSVFPIGDGSHRLLYQTPYYGLSDGNVSGQLIYILDTDRIDAALSPAFELGAGFLYIQDASGQPLTSMEREGWTMRSIDLQGEKAAEGSVERTIDGKRMVVTYCKSAENGWSYVIAVPKSTLVSAALGSLRSSLAAMAVFAVLGTIAILASYLYNLRPLTNMVQHLNIAPSGSALPLRHRINNGLWTLSGSITSLVRDKSDLEEQLEQQWGELRRAFFVQLVTGQLTNEPDLPETLHRFGIDGTCRRIRGAYLRLASQEAIETPDVRERIESIIAQQPSSATLVPCFWLDARHLAFLCLETDDAPVGSCLDTLQGIHFALLERYGWEAIFALGAECDSYADAHLSFTEARKLLAGSDGNLPILRASEPDPAHRETYAYGAREEDALLDLANAGRFDEVRALLDRIRRANFLERRLSPDMRELLFYRMTSTLLCAGWGARLPLNRVALSQIETNAFFELLLAQYAIACEQNARRLQEHRERMKAEIVAYIDQNYCDRNMGLRDLSQRFGVTESYLSTLIKGLVGENFSNYLESKRIDDANRLLRAGGIPISEIGRRVGYDSATSFGRAYKRVMGVSPSQYLKMHGVGTL